jgi:hypothetical protein
MNGIILGVLLNLHLICVSLRIAGVVSLVYGYSDENYPCRFAILSLPGSHLEAQSTIAMSG